MKHANFLIKLCIISSLSESLLCFDEPYSVRKLSTFTNRFRRKIYGGLATGPNEFWVDTGHDLHDFYLNTVRNPLLNETRNFIEIRRKVKPGDVIGYFGYSGWWYVYNYTYCIRFRNWRDEMEEDLEYTRSVLPETEDVEDLSKRLQNKFYCLDE